MSEEKILSVEVQRDIVPHIVFLQYEDKSELIKQVGYRQFAGEVGSDLSGFPIAQLMLEALYERCGYMAEKKDKGHVCLGDKKVQFNLHIPKKLKSDLEKEKVNTGKSMNVIILEVLRHKINNFKPKNYELITEKNPDLIKVGFTEQFLIYNINYNITY